MSILGKLLGCTCLELRFNSDTKVANTVLVIYNAVPRLVATNTTVEPDHGRQRQHALENFSLRHFSDAQMQDGAGFDYAEGTLPLHFIRALCMQCFVGV